MNMNDENGLAEKFHRVRKTMLMFSENSVLPYSEFCIMSIINKNDSPDGISVSDIAARLKISTPAVSRTLRSLGERGLIERRVNAENRRSTMITLTDKGKEIVRSGGEKFVGMMEYVRDKMGRERLEEFNLLFNEVLNIMSDYIIKKKEECSDDKNA